MLENPSINFTSKEVRHKSKDRSLGNYHISVLQLTIKFSEIYEFCISAVDIRVGLRGLSLVLFTRYELG
jgi:hypothetical protein